MKGDRKQVVKTKTTYRGEEKNEGNGESEKRRAGRKPARREKGKKGKGKKKGTC